MISFQDLMKGFGVITVMNACIYKLSEGSYVNISKCEHNNSQRALTPFDFECTHLYLDTLKIANLTMEGPTKTITGGQYSNPLLKYGKTMTLEMQNALGNAELLKTFFGCDYDETNGVLSVTDKFPGAFAIEGETFFIDQKTGEKKKVWIFIPNFTPDGVFNLTQDAEGDAAVFDCNGTIGMARIKDTAHPDGHDIFYHIADKSWLRYGYIITTDTILNYSLQRDDTYAVEIPDTATGDIVIPALHNGKRVTELLLCHSNSVKNVYIPSTITSIVDEAFKGVGSLKKVVFGSASTLRIIGDEAFAETPNLSSIILPSSLRYIGVNAFYLSKVLEIDYDEHGLSIYSYIGNWCVQRGEHDNGPPSLRANTIGVAKHALYDFSGYVDTVPNSVKYINPQLVQVATKVEVYDESDIYGPTTERYYLGNKINPHYCLIEYVSSAGENTDDIINDTTFNCQIYSNISRFPDWNIEKSWAFISPCVFGLEENSITQTVHCALTKKEAIDMGAPWVLNTVDTYDITLKCTDGNLTFKK